MPLPLLALAGLNLGNSLLSGWLASRQQKEANQAAQEAERRRIALIQAAIAKMGPNARQYAQELKGSDVYRQGLMGLFSGATQVGNTYNRAAGESGVKSGIGAAGGGLANAAYAFQRPGLDATMQQMAEQRAQAQMQAEVGGIGNVPMSYPGSASFNPFSALAGPLAQYTLGRQQADVPQTKITPQASDWASQIPAPSPLMSPVSTQSSLTQQPAGPVGPGSLDPRLAALMQFGYRPGGNRYAPLLGGAFR